MRQRKVNLNIDEIGQIVTGNLIRGAPPKVEDDAQATPFDLGGITLIGILAGSPRYARASILLKGERSAEAYAIGDTVSGAKIAAIYQEHIVVEDASGSRFDIYLNESRKQKNTTTTAASAKRAATKKGAKVEKIVLNRDRFKQLISNQADLFRLKFAPSIEGGKVRGWRLLRVPSDHFLYSMGARSGDIIRRYNGQELLNQDRMISMWQSLQNANQVTVDIERGGKLITYDISIQ